jgi:hypothetical protein
MWPKPIAPFAVRRSNHPIGDYHLPDAIDPGITYSNSFAEWEAATVAGLDMWRWEQAGGYPNWFKAKVLAWYKNHNLVEAHTQAAVNAKMKKASKKK